MIDLLKKYLSQDFFGENIKALKKRFTDNINSDGRGVIINSKYYPCVSELFIPKDAQKNYTFKNKSCFNIQRILGITKQDAYKCNQCFLECVNNYTSDNATIKFK